MKSQLVAKFCEQKHIIEHYFLLKLVIINR